MGLTFSDCYEKKRKENDGEETKKLALKTSKNISEGLNTNKLKEETTTLEDERLNSNQSSSDTPRKKIIADRYELNYSSNNSNFDNSSLNLDLENKFFSFEQCHKQHYLLSKSFVNIKSSEFLKKIDEFFEKEQELHRKTFSNDLNIEAIIEKVNSDSNFSKSTSNSNVVQNISNYSDSVKKKYFFIIITNTCLYDLEYITSNESALTLKRKIFFPCIEFFSITSDHMKLILHINSKLDKNGNFGISHENCVLIAFCISNLNYYMSKKKHILFVVPKSKMLVDKIKYISSLEKYKKTCNHYATEFYKSLNQTIPSDITENLLKLIPLNKIESKFTEVFCDKILVITNKKIIELDSENVDNAKINIIPLCKLKKLMLSSKNHKIQFNNDENCTFNYSTLYAKSILELVRVTHSKECLSELDVIIS